MKFYRIFSIVALLFIGNMAFAQTVYGSFNPVTKKATLTANPTAIAQKFVADLGDPGAIVSNIRIITYGTDNSLMLMGNVTNSKDKVNVIGVEVVTTTTYGIVARTLPTGPSVQHTCIGNPCSNCDFTFSGTLGHDVGCECKEVPTEGKVCNHSITMVIGW